MNKYKFLLTFVILLSLLFSGCGGPNSIDPRGGTAVYTDYKNLNEVLPSDNLLKNIDNKVDSITNVVVFSDDGSLVYNHFFRFFLTINYEDLVAEISCEISRGNDIVNEIDKYQISPLKYSIKKITVTATEVYIIVDDALNDNRNVIAIFEYSGDLIKISGINNVDFLEELLSQLLQ